MISLQRVPENHPYQPNNVCPSCLDVFQEKPEAEAFCHEGLKDPRVLQCFMDKSCAEVWARAVIENVGLNRDGSINCYNCRTPVDPTSILNQYDEVFGGRSIGAQLVKAAVISYIVSSSLYAGSFLGDSLLTKAAFAAGACAMEVLPLYGAYVMSKLSDDGLLGVVTLVGGAAALGASLAACAGKGLVNGVVNGVASQVAIGAAAGVGLLAGTVIEMNPTLKSVWNYFRGDAA